MHLVRATSDYVLANRALPRFPILLWEDMRSCVEVNQFLRFYLLRAAIGSKKSWAQIAQALYDYFGFLEVHGLAWDGLGAAETKPLLAAYRDYCFEEARLKRDTVRLRILYVCEFYAFAHKRKWIDQPPFEYEERVGPRRNYFLAHTDTSGTKTKVRSAMPKKHPKLPRFLLRDQAQQLIRAATNRHHNIIIRTALGIGLRREELASFPASYVFDPDKRSPGTRNVHVLLDPEDGSGMRTKGSRPREVLVSRELMRLLHHYLIHYRRERASLRSPECPNLFLTQDGTPWANDGKGIEAMVRKIGKRVGIHVHPHMLRHTYATHTLARLQSQRDVMRQEPLVFLQKQLGHSSPSQTMVYLHIVNDLSDAAVLEYGNELNDWEEAQAEWDREKSLLRGK
jgi:integrase